MEEWKEYKATDFCKNVTDGTHDSPKQKSEGYYLITSKHIKGNTIDFDSAYKISEEDYNKIIQRSKVDQWDVIISMIGAYCGFCYLEKSTKTDYAIKNVGLFKVGSEIKSKWLYYYLSSPAGQNKLHLLRTGSSQPYIALNSLRNFTIPVPDEKTMRSIIYVLQSLDDKIECNRRINENLEQQAQALFKSWFVDFEPFKDQPFVESELGMIPQGWKVGTLSEIADIIMGTSPSGSSYNTEGKGDVFYQGRAEFGFRFPERNLYTTEAKRFADVDTVLVSVRAPVGDINVAEEKCCIGRGLASVRSNKGFNSFILYLMQSLKPVFDRFNGEGTVFGSINKKAFEDLKVVIPDERSVMEFDSISSRIDSQIKRTVLESRRLAELRDALLPRLMSGELKVNDLENNEI